MTASAFSTFLTFGLYVLASFSVYQQLRKDGQVSRSLTLVAGLSALIAHVWFLSSRLITPEGLHLGLFPVTSTVAATGVAVVLISSLYRPVEWVSALVYPFAALTIPAAAFIHTGYMTHPMPMGLGVHVLLSIIAYAVMALAASQAILLAIQHRQLKQGHITGVMRVFPPIQMMEKMLFEAIWVGQILLTLAMLMGVMYVNNLFAQSLAHKTIITFVAWAVFAVLLAGRHWFGWRGPTAVRFTLVGFAVLVLGFFGSQLVVEVILNRG